TSSHSQLSLSASVLFFLSLVLSPGRCRALPPFPTRRSSDLRRNRPLGTLGGLRTCPPLESPVPLRWCRSRPCRARHRCHDRPVRSEEHTSELQSRFDLVCRLLLEKKKNKHRVRKGRTKRRQP